MCSNQKAGSAALLADICLGSLVEERIAVLPAAEEASAPSPVTQTIARPGRPQMKAALLLLAVCGLTVAVRAVSVSTEPRNSDYTSPVDPVGECLTSPQLVGLI